MCNVSTVEGTFILTSLGELSFKDSALGFALFFSACANVEIRSSACPASPALQVTFGDCLSLGNLDTRTSAPLLNGVGVSLTFGGGSGNRNARLEVECFDGPTSVLHISAVGPTQLYQMRARARAGCPLSCALDPTSGYVCGGGSRGVCAVKTNGSASCDCFSGFAGPHCSAIASDLVCPFTFPLLFLSGITFYAWFHCYMGNSTADLHKLFMGEPSSPLAHNSRSLSAKQNNSRSLGTGMLVAAAIFLSLLLFRLHQCTQSNVWVSRSIPQQFVSALPQNACTSSPRFAYLVTISGDSFPPATGEHADVLKDTDIASFYVSWRVRIPNATFHPGTFGENRNLLLELAVAEEKRRGCRFLYYIFVDEHTPRMKLNPETATIDGIQAAPGVTPFVAFRQLLLDWMPALGYPRYSFMPLFDPSQPVVARPVINIDHVLLAVHFTAARWLLPYAIDIESFHWWQAQAVVNLLASMLFLESSLEFRSCESFPKDSHVSASTTNNGMKPFDANLAELYLRGSVLPSSLLASRIFPLLSGTVANNIARRNNGSVRFDLDVRALGAKPDHAMWTRANLYWSHLGAPANCNSGFCGLQPAKAAAASMLDCSVRQCLD